MLVGAPILIAGGGSGGALGSIRKEGTIMRNLINAPASELEEIPTQSIPRQVHPNQRRRKRPPLTERAYNRLIREAGRKETALTLRVARAMKYGQPDEA